MPDVAGKQVISGEHLVRPDGRISLGVYGSVYVAGMTLDEVKQATEAHLSKYIYRPEVYADVLAYNSKVYYVITDGGGFGEQVERLPYTGNETVLDAISQIDGLSQVSSKKIWVARPGPADMDCAQTMPVDWCAVTRDAATATNYQILPGDRIYIKADDLIAFDNVVMKVVTPFERIFGFILLGNGTVRQLQQGSNTTGGGFF
jgi:protein involved in polysaccharide export with SLBB domain